MPTSPARAPLLLAALLSISASAWSPPAAADPPPRVVNRVVAVVGDEPITLRALLLRSAPFQKRIDAGPPDGREAASKAMLGELLDRMVTEALFARRAGALHVEVSPDEIARALQLMASGNGATVPELLATVAKDGISEADVRAQARQQILEYKVLAVEKVDLATTDEAELGRRSKRYIDAIKKVIAVEVRL